MYEYNVKKVLKVVDGDTIDVDIENSPFAPSGTIYPELTVLCQSKLLFK